MSKARKKTSEKSKAEQQEQNLDVQGVEIEETAFVQAEDQRLNLRDAATRFIAGFKEHHWSAIRKYADSLGVGEEATVDQCLEVFQGYGAKLK